MAYVFSRLLSASVVLAMFLADGISEATIQRLDICDVHFQPSEAVPVIREVPAYVVVRGDLVDTHTSIEKNSLISVDQVGKTGGGGVNTSVTLKITPRADLGIGHHTIKLHYLVEVKGPDVFKINVPAPRVNHIDPDPKQASYPTGTPVTFTARGTALSNVHLSSIFNSNSSALNNVTPISTTNPDTEIKFTAKVMRPFDLLSASFTLTNIQLQDSCLSNHAAGTFKLPINVTGATQAVPRIPKVCNAPPGQVCP